ncbi:hypothetical protein [Streptomyces virginiae]|uniref:hypothetical protein n=1 Tax=Streptomyces virginiae TaxID=1961 RepID=UPI00224ED8B5|nr:hypothetical protein [Streptomyces virginiae]MCX4960960.1 hypothetical protein [Streptomyces virginiae]
MTSLDHDPAPAPSSGAEKALRWVTALTFLATLTAVAALALTDNVDHVGTVLGIGVSAAAGGGTVHTCIHLRR